MYVHARYTPETICISIYMTSSYENYDSISSIAISAYPQTEIACGVKKHDSSRIAS